MPISAIRLLIPLLGFALAPVLSGQTPDEQSEAVQQAWALADQAREFARSPEPGRSLPLYEQALQLAPSLHAIELDYGVALAWSGRYRDAAALFRIIRRERPDQPPWAQLEMANAELFGGHAEEAFQLFDRIVESGDRREPILTRRALALRRAGIRDEAALAYREALGFYPDSETAALGIVECFLDRRQVSDAHAFLATWSGGKGRSSQILAWRGWLLSRLGRHAEAEQVIGEIPNQEFASQAEVIGKALRERFASQAITYVKTPALYVSPAVETLAVELPGIETGRPLTRQAERLAAEGVILAREGRQQQGASYLRRAIAMSPTHYGIRRDYAIVLTWSERYVEARREFDYVFLHEPNQPAWSRSDRAQAELFGGDAATALQILNELLSEGHVDEHNLIRKGLALRWIGQPAAAERLYKQVAALYPSSISAHDGLIHSLADQNRLGAAIKSANKSLDQLPDHWELMKSKAQVLNWAGRHLNAEKTLAAVPEEQSFQSDVLHHRALAARWSDDAQSASEYARTFVERYPGHRDAYRLREDLAYQYGYVMRTSANYFADNFDYVSQGIRQEFEAPLTLKHRFDAGVNRQSFTEGTDAARWTTYSMGWTGQMSRRLSAHASAGQVLYSGNDRAIRLSLDASASLVLSDRARLRAGAGQAPTTAFRAVQRRVQTQYGYLEADTRPTLNTQVSARFGQTGFSGNTRRTGINLSAFRTLRRSGWMRLRVGGRNNWILHNRRSQDVYSPDTASSHIGAIQMEGTTPGQIEYTAEFGAGVQYETGEPRGLPFTATLEIAKPLSRVIWLRFQTGYSNSSVDRTNAAGPSYRMSYANVQLDYRLRRNYE